MKKAMLVVITIITIFVTSCGAFEVPKTGSVSEIAETCLKEFEGLRLTAYNDGTGTMTIGYGSTKKSLVAKGTITEAEAVQQLQSDITACKKVVNDAVTVELNAWQEAALISFVFNCGGKAFRDSTLLKELNAGNYDKVPAELRRWIYSKGQKLRGLKNRREKEILLWNYKPEK